MIARELNGNHVGQMLMWRRSGQVPRYFTDEVTMILHKKNGNVSIRHGKRGAQNELKPDVEVHIVNGMGYVVDEPIR